MSIPRPPLEQIQRWMQSVIMHPGGVSEGVASPEARRHLEVSADALEEVISPSRSLDSVQRLEIYVDAYFERLLECLREEFAATRQALGDELFHAVAFGYLQQYPSRSYTLGQLGARFAAYLAESRLHAHAVPAEGPPDWADFVIELATFERLQREVFDGPGVEGQAAGLLAELSAVDEADWGGLRLVAAPCLRVCEFHYAVDTYWWAAVSGELVPDIRPTARRLAIHRRDYVLERHPLSAAQFCLLQSLVDGQSLAAAIQAAAARADGEDAGWLDALGDWFRRWAQQQFFTAIAHRA